ncbi:protein kinase domain-containing protein [Amphibacillus sediminis]|uniref:protein kinase domain-containing protein n=1 Tax=Amphibacillus sediminis TaxID=360185 RepID=UPI00083084F4|nr:protein kinase [Amphibacillus sediminis]
MLNQSKAALAYKLSPGMLIKGKWHCHHYQIHKLLGKGAIGAVYLAKQDDKKMVALKISDKTASISSEINVLKKLAKVQGDVPGPSLFEVDDWVDPMGYCYPFYTMEYVRGDTLDSFLKKRGSSWLGPLYMQLLEELDRLHQAGYVMGDLKLANVIVTSNPVRLRFIDVGGITPIGRAVKEYTEFYDRGHWQCGDRRAEPKYDLFALAMMALNYAYPHQFSKSAQPKRELLLRLKRANSLKPYQGILENALLGRYETCQQMRKAIQKELVSQKIQKQNRSVGHNQNQDIHWLEPFILSVVSFILFILATFY